MAYEYDSPLSELLIFWILITSHKWSCIIPKQNAELDIRKNYNHKVTLMGKCICEAWSPQYRNLKNIYFGTYRNFLKNYFGTTIWNFKFCICMWTMYFISATEFSIVELHRATALQFYLWSAETFNSRNANNCKQKQKKTHLLSMQSNLNMAFRSI